LAGRDGRRDLDAAGVGDGCSLVFHTRLIAAGGALVKGAESVKFCDVFGLKASTLFSPGRGDQRRRRKRSAGRVRGKPRINDRACVTQLRSAPQIL
jgi:hypothetical protein